PGRVRHFIRRTDTVRRGASGRAFASHAKLRRSERLRPSSTWPTAFRRRARPAMTTKLDKTLRREILIDREPWVVTLTPAGIKLTRKGRRKGLELEWKPLVN